MGWLVLPRSIWVVHLIHHLPFHIRLSGGTPDTNKWLKVVAFGPLLIQEKKNSLCQVLVFFSCQTKPFSQKRCLPLLVLERYLTNSSENGLFKRGSPHAWIIHKLCQSSMDSDMEL